MDRAPGRCRRSGSHPPPPVRPPIDRAWHPRPRAHGRPLPRRHRPRVERSRRTHRHGRGAARVRPPGGSVLAGTRLRDRLGAMRHAVDDLVLSCRPCRRVASRRNTAPTPGGEVHGGLRRDPGGPPSLHYGRAADHGELPFALERARRNRSRRCRAHGHHARSDRRRRLPARGAQPLRLSPGPSGIRRRRSWARAAARSGAMARRSGAPALHSLQLFRRRCRSRAARSDRGRRPVRRGFARSGGPARTRASARPWTRLAGAARRRDGA